MDMARHDGVSRFAVKGDVTCEGFKEHHRECVQIRAVIDLLVSLGLFGGHIQGGSERCIGLCDRCLFVDGTGNSKVDDLDVWCVLMGGCREQKDIAGFEIAVEKTLLVDVIKARADLRKQARDLVKAERHSAALEQILKCVTFEPLHHQKSAKQRIFVCMQKVHDVGMLKSCKKAGFSEKTLSPCDLGLSVGMEHFDGNVLLGLDVCCLKDRRHPSRVDAMLEFPTRKQNTIFPQRLG